MIGAVFNGGGKVVDWADATLTKAVLMLPYGQAARGWVQMRRGNRGPGALTFVAGLGGMLFATGFIGSMGLKVRQWRDDRYVQRVFWEPLDRLPFSKTNPREMAIKAARCVLENRDETICRNIYKAVMPDALNRKSIYELARECKNYRDGSKKIHEFCARIGPRLSELYEKEITSDSLFEKIPQELWVDGRVFPNNRHVGLYKWKLERAECGLGVVGAPLCLTIASFARNWINRARAQEGLPCILPESYVKIQETTTSISL